MGDGRLICGGETIRKSQDNINFENFAVKGINQEELRWVNTGVFQGNIIIELKMRQKKRRLMRGAC